ncbi:hypothetical protein HYW46_00285 [Candidatus Daviesbacteria bacterium]|nr:hypothetical protein [Candidatus Daviesbacteria bacterium]
MGPKKVIIGLIGEIGSGKGTFVDLLMQTAPNLKISKIRFSDVLSDTLKIWGIPLTRSNLQNLAVIMKNNFGPVLSHAVYMRVLSNPADIVILDGVRWQSDVDLVRGFPKNYLVYVTAPVAIRYDRIRSRKEKEGELNIPYEQFMKEEQTENEILIPKIGTGADFKIINGTTLEQFKQQVQRFYDKFLNRP